jgi:hypothetical protein
MYLFSTLCKNRDGGNIMKYLASLFGIILITSCATSQEIVLPSGERGFTINCGSYEGDSWSACYQKAGEVCPSGYEILEKSEEKDKNIVANPYSFQTLEDDKRTLVIECKKES